MNSKDIFQLTLNLVRQQNQQCGYTSVKEWGMQDFTAFLKLFCTELTLPKDYFWKLDSISKSLNGWISGHLNSDQKHIW
jgi:hypothetical protein